MATDRRFFSRDGARSRFHRDGRWGRAWSRGRLFEPVDASALAAFRIAFGALMLVAVGRYFAYGWIEQFYVAPRVYFPYPGLEWIAPLPAWAMYALFAGLGACAVGIALGAWSRPSAALFCLGFTYAHLIDRTHYLNHYYLISLLALLLAVVPAHRTWSLDARRRPPREGDAAPRWAVWILRFQLAVVYGFGAVAKLTPDWLLRAQPLRIWLGANVDLPVLGPWLEPSWVAYAGSYAGLLFDGAVVPLLLWRRTRLFAYGAVLVFHLLTAALFPIGMFPWLMIGLTPIFFAPDWPRRLLRGAVRSRPATPAPPPWPRLAAAALAGYVLVQVAVPLRHLGAGGELHWHERGFRWSWQIMAMEKYGQAAFRVDDPVTRRSWSIAPADELTPLQARMMATQPDMILSYARLLSERYGRRLGHPVAVRADVRVSLNGRPHRHLIDPRRDLASVSADGTDAVLPLGDPTPHTDDAAAELAGVPRRAEPGGAGRSAVGFAPEPG